MLWVRALTETTSMLAGLSMAPAFVAYAAWRCTSQHGIQGDGPPQASCHHKAAAARWLWAEGREVSWLAAPTQHPSPHRQHGAHHLIPHMAPGPRFENTTNEKNTSLTELKMTIYKYTRRPNTSGTTCPKGLCK